MQERRKRGIKGFYMLHNYGKIHPSTHPNNHTFILRLLYPDLHNSFVTFNLDATDLSFVVNIGRGRIVSAESRGFNRSSHTVGEVVVVVENLSDISQDFTLSLVERAASFQESSHKPWRNQYSLLPPYCTQRQANYNTV